jgi:hypothetical protein
MAVLLILFVEAALTECIEVALTEAVQPPFRSGHHNPSVTPTEPLCQQHDRAAFHDVDGVLAPVQTLTHFALGKEDSAYSTGCSGGSR